MRLKFSSEFNRIIVGPKQESSGCWLPNFALIRSVHWGVFGAFEIVDKFLNIAKRSNNAESIRRVNICDRTVHII